MPRSKRDSTAPAWPCDAIGEPGSSSARHSVSPQHRTRLYVFAAYIARQTNITEVIEARVNWRWSRINVFERVKIRDRVTSVALTRVISRSWVPEFTFFTSFDWNGSVEIDRNIVKGRKVWNESNETKRKEERNKRDRRETCSLYRELSFERTINTRYTRVPSLFFSTFAESVCRLTIILASPRTVPINVPVINTCLRECRKRQERATGQANLFVHVPDDVPLVRQVTSFDQGNVHAYVYIYI